MREDKFFNIAGPIIPEKHYYLPLRFHFKALGQLIDRHYYFSLHAPRQTGKTTAIFKFSKELNLEHKNKPLYVNVEAAHTARGNVQAGINSILKAF